MSSIEQFRGMKRRIVEMSMRGESPNDIAVEVGTTLPYVYNVRAEARKRGITFSTITTNDQIQPGPAREAAQVPPQNQDIIKAPQGQVPDQDNADVRERIKELRTRARRRELLVEEEYLKALEEEDQLQSMISDITHDPRELLVNGDKYVQAMKRIMENEPWRYRLYPVSDVNRGVYYDRLEYMIRTSYLTICRKTRSSSSDTPLRDLANAFIDYAKHFEIGAWKSAVDWNNLVYRAR